MPESAPREVEQMTGASGPNSMRPMPKMVEGPPGCPKRSFNYLQQFHIIRAISDLCTGGLSPGRIQLGNPCSSAHLARGPPNRRDGQAIAASAITIRGCIECEQETINPVLTIRLLHSPPPHQVRPPAQADANHSRKPLHRLAAGETPAARHYPDAQAASPCQSIPAPTRD